MDRVNNDGARVLITRRRGRAAALMSREDFNAHEETAHLLSSAANAVRLRAARAQVEKEIARRTRRQHRR